MERLQKQIINLLSLKAEVSFSDFADTQASRQTFARAISPLIDNKIVEMMGAGPSSRYVVGTQFYLADIDVDSYFQVDQNSREVKQDDNFFVNSLNLISDTELYSLEILKKEWQKRYDKAEDSIKDKEYERITIELAWKSSQIEGNTYSLLDTERLIKEEKEAKGHTHEEAIMILNHKRCLKYILDNKSIYDKLTKSKIEDIHSILIDGLNVDKGLRRSGVGIVGTEYKPHDNQYQVGEQLEALIDLFNSKYNTLAKALSAIILIAYIQPFADGNKRTSRMLANAILIAAGYPPISFRSIDEVAYKKAIILCYELKNMSYIKKLFLEQYTEACTKYFV